MNSKLIKPQNIIPIDKHYLKDVNWTLLKSSQEQLDIMWSTQTQFNKQQIDKFTHFAQLGPTLWPAIYSNRDFIDAIDDVYSMDDHLSKFQHIVLLHDEKGRYSGHIYLFLHPEDDKAYAIGIRGRPDKFLIPKKNKCGNSTFERSLFVRKRGEEDRAHHLLSKT